MDAAHHADFASFATAGADDAVRASRRDEEPATMMTSLSRSSFTKSRLALKIRLAVRISATRFRYSIIMLALSRFSILFRLLSAGPPRLPSIAQADAIIAQTLHGSVWHVDSMIMLSLTSHSRRRGMGAFASSGRCRPSYGSISGEMHAGNYAVLAVDCWRRICFSKRSRRAATEGFDVCDEYGDCFGRETFSSAAARIDYARHDAASG